MTYIPKKLINPGLRAVGSEFVDADTKKPYRGSYHQNFDGKTFTGVDQYDPNKKEIIPNPTKQQSTTQVINTPQNNSYSEINTKNSALLKYGKDPESFTPSPSSQDYRRGSINRYFAKRITEKPQRVKEISRSAYNSLSSKDGKYNYAIWRVFQITWRISGTESQIKSTNKKIVDTANRDFRGIRSYLRNLDQFYKAPVETPTPSRTFRDNNSNTGLRPRGETRNLRPNRLKDLY